jgi:hypothetical protein
VDGPRRTPPLFPFRVLKLRFEPDPRRHRHEPFPLCGRLGLQSFLDPPVVPYWFNTPSTRFAAKLRLEVYPTSPEENP